MPNEKKRAAFYGETELLRLADTYLRTANCRSRNEFINQAIRFYIAYLQKESDAEFLTPALESVLSGMLGGVENRIGRVLFKLAVELSMTMHIIAAQGEVNEDTLTRLRGYCVDEVKRLNGKISFDKAWEHQRD
jgi:hypothetical protein